MDKQIVLKEFGLENFRVFKDKTNFELAPITLLTGPNSSGKSSVIKAMKLMQNFHTAPQQDMQKLDFSEDECNSTYYHQLGNFELVKTDGDSSTNEITLSYKINSVANRFLGNDFYENLYVENTFVLDQASLLKNGQLVKSSLFVQIDGDKIKIAEKNSSSNGEYYLNYFSLIKLFLSLSEDFDQFKLQFDPYIVKVKTEEEQSTFDSIERNNRIATILDYTGEVEYCWLTKFAEGEELDNLLYAYYPDIAEFCKFAKLNYNIFHLLGKAIEIEGGEDEIIDALPFEAKPTFYSFVEQYKASFTNSVLDLILQFSQDGKKEFEEYLCHRFIKKYPSLNITQESFLDLITAVDNEIKKDLQDKDFDSEYGTLGYTNLILQENTCTLDLIYEFLQNPYQIISKHSKYKIPPFIQFFSIVEYLNMLDYYLMHYGEQDWYNGYTKDVSIQDIKLMGFFNKRHFQDNFNMQLSDAFNSCEFIEAVKANTQRLYTFTSQGTSFNRFLSKFIDDLNKTDDIAISNGVDVNEVLPFINKWIKKFEIGDSLDFQSGLIDGVGTQLNIMDGNKKINIVDLGHGITQIVALLLRIGYSYKRIKNTILIEEPDTHLHPKLQSKLADLFIDAHEKLGLNFIIETHSEYLIRKLQYLTAKKTIKPDDTVIYYIGNPNPSMREPGEEQVRKINIKPNGQLTKPFGSGFTDESSHWIKKLFVFHNQN